MSLIKQLAGHTIIYGFGHIISRILYFVVLTTYLTNRLPDTKEYGIYAEMYAYASILIVILSYRIDTAFFRFGNKKENMAKAFSAAFFPLIITTVSFVILILLTAQGTAQLIGYGDTPQYVKWFALILGFDVLVLLPYARLRLKDKAMKFMGFKILNIIITIILVFFFLEFYSYSDSKFLSSIIPPVSSEVDYVFISNLIASALIFLFMIFDLGKIKIEIDWALWKKMLLYAAPLIIVGIAGSFNQFFAVPLQKFLLGNSYEENLTQAGIYAAPQRIAALLALFTTAFNYAAEPFFFKNADRKDAKDLYGKIGLLFTMVGGLAVLGIIYFIDLFQYLIGENYREGLVIVPILLFAYLLLGIYYNFSIWYKLSDNTKYGAIISTIGAVITFGMSLVLLPQIGYIASAWAALVTYTVMNIIVYLIGQRIYPINYPIKKIILVLILLIIFSFIGIQVDNHLAMLPAYVIKVLMLFLYLFCAYQLEKEGINSLIKS